MRHHTRAAFLLALSIAAPAAESAAQPRPKPPVPSQAARRPAADPRFTISLNGGYQPTITEFEDTFTFSVYQETGTTRVSYPVEKGAVIDAGVGVRLWRGLGAGVAVSRFGSTSTAAATSSIPHPFFLQQHREISGDATGMERIETAAHVQIQYQLPLRGRLQVLLMGGPSFLDITQTMVIDVNYTEEYPYDVATFASVDSQRASGSAAGFNAGLDLRWMFTRNIGAGALVRFSRAAIELDGPQNRTLSVDAGGGQVGAGLRIVF